MVWCYSSLVDLLSNDKFLNFLRILFHILLYFQIFKYWWCIAANYEKNVTVMKENYYILVVKTLSWNMVIKVHKLQSHSKKQLKKGSTFTGKNNQEINNLVCFIYLFSSSQNFVTPSSQTDQFIKKSYFLQRLKNSQLRQIFLNMFFNFSWLPYHQFSKYMEAIIIS